MVDNEKKETLMTLRGQGDKNHFKLMACDVDWASRDTGPEQAWRSSPECKCANEDRHRSKEEEVEKLSTACSYLSWKKELFR